MAVQAKFITWPPTVHPSTISSLHNARWVLIHQPLTERELICSSSCKNEKTCIVVLPRWAIGKSLVEGRSITLFRICCRIAVIHVKDNFFMFHLYTNKRLEAWEQLERSNSKGARWHNWITELRKESSIPFSAFCLANLLSDFSPSPWRFLKSQTLKIWESKKGPFLYLYKGVHQTTRKFPPLLSHSLSPNHLAALVDSWFKKEQVSKRPVKDSSKKREWGRQDWAVTISWYCFLWCGWACGQVGLVLGWTGEPWQPTSCHQRRWLECWRIMGSASWSCLRLMRGS